MYYRHKYFILDSKAKKVFDENQKELRLTGNAYRVLVFLCDKGHSTVTDIGDDLDRARNYDEDHIRQYRYKINTIIGKNIVEYKNSIYSIIGDVKKLEKLEKNDRNTVLLREDSVKLKNKNKLVEKLKNIKFSKIPAIIAIIALLLTFIDWHSYGYYTLMKFVVTGVAAYYVYYIYEVVKKQDFWFWGLAVIAILFNPIIPIYLGDKDLWMAIDVVVIGFLVGAVIKFRKDNN
ncbi:MAG: hypothetical protein Q8N21_02140 [bacterium]|nr:hypothetical protein [bacterium]